jgi:transposase
MNIKEFEAKYPTEEACLEEIFQNRYGNLKECPNCKKPTKFHRLAERKCYSCQFCGYQLHPLAGTIFHKSKTLLKDWFYAIFLFSNSKNGVSAKELQRQLAVTYKTAWRMCKQIRKLMKQDEGQLGGTGKTVEADETLIGGTVDRLGSGRHLENKTIVFGAVERKGEVKATVITDVKASTVMPLVRSMVKIGTDLMTDELHGYRRAPEFGFKHSAINHRKKQYVKGSVHTNTIEGFWSQLKRSLNGTYHSVSPKYLQTYVDEFAYRYSKRTYSSLFLPMILRASMRA